MTEYCEQTDMLQITLIEITDYYLLSLNITDYYWLLLTISDYYWLPRFITVNNWLLLIITEVTTWSTEHLNSPAVIQETGQLHLSRLSEGIHKQLLPERFTFLNVPQQSYIRLQHTQIMMMANYTFIDFGDHYFTDKDALLHYNTLHNRKHR